MIESRCWIGDYEVRPGTRIPYVQSRLRRLSLDIVTVCDGEKPDRWHAEVLLLGEVLVRTSQFDSHEQAGREAERLFIEKTAALFA